MKRRFYPLLGAAMLLLFLSCNAITAQSQSRSSRTIQSLTPELQCPVDTDRALRQQASQQHAGVLSGASPTLSFAEHACYDGITFSGTDHAYEVLTFTVDEAGWYTFLLAANFDAFFGIYQGEFNPNDPCGNITGLALSAYDLPLGNVLNPPSEQLSFFLHPTQNYSILVSNQDAQNLGAWMVIALGENGGLINEFSASTPRLIEHQLLCGDSSSLLFSTPQQWLVNTDGTIDTAATREQFFGGNQVLLDDFLQQLSYTGIPTTTNNCGPLILQLNDLLIHMGDCGDKVISRTFTAEPAEDSGCPTELITCQQLITLGRPELSDIIPPPMTYSIPCDEDYQVDGPTGGADDNPSADLSGWPVIRGLVGISPLADTYCNLGSIYSDESRINICQGSYKFRRNWDMIDWCIPGTTREFPQIISIEDQVGPIISGIPDTIVVSTSLFSCLANVEVLVPTVEDGNGCSGATPTVYLVLAFGETFFAGGNIADGDVFQIPPGPYTIFYCAEDECGNETCNEYDLIITDEVEPVAICPAGFSVSIGGGDVVNGIEGIGRVPAETFDQGSYDNCGPVNLEIRRNYWRNGTCDLNPNRKSPWGDFIDFYCCDLGNDDITIELRVTDLLDQQSICFSSVSIQDVIAPYCYAPDDTSFSCMTPPDGLPDDLEVAYANDFAATSTLMSSLFGSPSSTDNCAIDTLVELTPLIQLNDCGAGTITRYFEAWQAVIDADLSDGIQIDEVFRSTNECTQIITVRPATDFEMAFPADAVTDCGMPAPAEVEITATGCDLLGVNTSITASYPPVGDECYQLAITYDVINWCQWDGEYEGFEIPRLTEEDGDSLATGYSVEAAERPILRMTTASGPDDENCDGILSPDEDDADDALDLQYFLTIDRSHPGAEGDSNLPNTRFDNVVGTMAECLPDDANGLSNYGRFRYTQLVRVFDAADLTIVVPAFGGPTSDCPNLQTGEFGDEDGDCEEDVSITFSPGSTCEVANNANLAYASLLAATLDAFATDTNGNGAIDADEFIADEDALDFIQENDDGSFTFSGSFPVSTLSSDNIVHALSVSFEDPCGNQASSIIEFEVVDCKAPAPICINGLTTTLQPQPDGTCAGSMHVSDFIAFEISDCTGQGPGTSQGLPVITSYAIYLVAEIDTIPNFVPSPSDSILILQEDSEETTVVNIVAFDNEGNYSACETYILVQHALGCEEGQISPFCFAPAPVTYSCSAPPENLPVDLEMAYNTDFANTSLLMNELFGAPTGSVVVDTLVELPPMIQLNDCGAGTITRFFEGWQALPDADQSDGLQVDEVIQSTNACRQIITVRPGSGFEIAFPADVDLECSSSAMPEVEITTSGCDVFSVNRSIVASYPPTANECYQLEIEYHVINWCQWDGEYEGFDIPRNTEEDGTMLATGFSVEAAERPILRMTSETGPDDEDCDGTISPSENEANDALDLRYSLTIDRSHPNAEGDSNLPDTQYDNIAATPAACIPADSGGRRNYGRFRYRQIVRVISVSDLTINVPEFGGPTTSCPNLQAGQFGDADGDCEEEVDISFALAQTCELIPGSHTPYVSIISATLDAFAVDNNGDGEIDTNEFVPDEDVLSQIDDLGGGNFTFSGSFPLSSLTGDNIVHALQVEFHDECGNMVSTIVGFEVVDCSAPAPICFSSMDISLSPQGDGSCAATVHARDFEASPIFDCTGQGPASQGGLLQVTSYAIYLAEEVNSNPDFTPNPADSTLFISDDNLETILTYVYAFDEQGNYNFCQTSIQAQLEADCLGSISGRITTRDDEPVKDVEINISNEFLVTTDLDGTYSIDALDRQGAYTIAPFLNSDFANGVKTIDMIILLKHLLGIQLMENPYQLIAADIDNSGDITQNDFDILQQFILGNIDVFPGNSSWRFIDADYVFPVPTNPWLENFPEIINLANLLTDATGIDFIGVKIGDLDDNAEANAQMLTDRSIRGTYPLYTDDVFMTAGELYRIPIVAPSIDDLIGLQGTLQFDGAEILGIEYGLASAKQIGLLHQHEGFVTFAWNRFSDQTNATNDEASAVLFTVNIRSRRSTLLSEVVQLGDRYTPREAYVQSEASDKNNPTGQLQNLDLQFNPAADQLPIADDQVLQLFQNTPNPFRSRTSISFVLAEEGRAVLTISDLSGRVLFVEEGHYKAGLNTIEIGTDRLTENQVQSGVLTYTLQTATGRKTKRMVLTN